MAEGLVLYGSSDRNIWQSKSDLVERLGITSSAFRAATKDIGGRPSTPRFFDTSRRNLIAFGGGAGVAVGVSVGTESLRAAVVDANGWLHGMVDEPPSPGQLQDAPEVLLARIAAVTRQSLARAAKESPHLLVDSSFALLGWAVAWPSPVNRARHPVGYALAHKGWRGEQPLHERVRNFLGDHPDQVRSFALNDANAAAIAVAYQQTHAASYLDDSIWKDHPRLGIVLRIAGGIGAAVIVVEPPSREPGTVRSGFGSSILLGGLEHHVGEIGHVTLNAGVVERRNASLPDGFPPLRPSRCSCSPTGQPPHLEAYASGVSLQARLNHSGSLNDAIADILKQQAPQHTRALKDVGFLLGEALAPVVAMLNPATITLTGSMAAQTVKDALEERLNQESYFGCRPEVMSVDPEDGKFLRARGAALALIRARVHRRLPALVAGRRATMRRRVDEVTFPLSLPAVQELGRQ